MFARSALAVTVLAGSAAAKTCMNMSVPVTISARTGVFNLPVPQTNLDSTAFIQNQTQQGRNFTETALSGYATTAGTYNISAQFCMPSSMNATTAKPTLQILTHGIGFDKTSVKGLHTTQTVLLTIAPDTGISPTITSITVTLT